MSSAVAKAIMLFNRFIDFLGMGLVDVAHRSIGCQDAAPRPSSYEWFRLRTQVRDLNLGTDLC